MVPNFSGVCSTFECKCQSGGLGPRLGALDPHRQVLFHHLPLVAGQDGGAFVQLAHMAGAPANLPPPLRGTDGKFTFDSIHRRLPSIIDEMLAHNARALSPAALAALQALRHEVTTDAPLTPLRANQPEGAWRGDLRALAEDGAVVADCAVLTWQCAPWFFVECYFYKRILDVLAEHGGPADPFAAQKQHALAGAAAAFATSVLPLAGSDE
jgi:hypothetical protein